MKVYQERTFLGKKLPYYVRRSTYIHIALFLFALIGGKVVLEQQERLRESNIELVQASVRVDMVAMPTHTLNELKNLSSGVEEAKKEEPTPTVEAEAKKEELKPEAIVESKEADTGPTFEEVNKLKRESFLSKLKQIGNKKVNSTGNLKADKGLYGDKSTDLKNLVLAGNKLSNGSSLYGDGNAGDLTAFQAYAARLPDLVRPHWRLPSFLMDKNLKCRIRVWIALNGEVFRTQVYQSSGEPEYDKRAMEAIKAASPLPGLSEEFGKRGLNGDIALGFPL